MSAGISTIKQTKESPSRKPSSTAIVKLGKVSRTEENNAAHVLYERASSAEKSASEREQSSNQDDGIFILYEREPDDSEDTFFTFIESKVKSLQTDVKCEKAEKIQKAVYIWLKYFLREVGKIEPLFRVSELLQVGSYAEGTKISKPDEFDFLAVIDVLSQPGTVIVERKSELVPGCVSVSLAQEFLNTPLNKLCINGTVQCFQSEPLSASFQGPKRFGTTFINAIYRKCFETQKQIREECYDHNKQSTGRLTMFTPVDIHFGSAGWLEAVDGVGLKLHLVEYKTPNVLIVFLFEGLEISVDLTPAIRYQRIDDCVERENCASPKLMKAVSNHGSVLLVGNRESQTGFRVTVTECEVLYMKNILNTGHKLLYIFLKYLCTFFDQKPHTWQFSSYMLKTVCIHHDTKCQSATGNIAECFGNILQDLTTYCTERKLPSVFNTEVNLFLKSLPPEKQEWHLRRHFLKNLRVLQQFQ